MNDIHMRNLVVVRRRRGRPKRRWQDCNEDDLRAIASSTEDALDWKEWRRIICTGDPKNGKESAEEDKEESEFDFRIALLKF